MSDAAPRIHPTSVIGPDVELAAGVDIGPLCLLDGKIRIGARTRLIGHVTILGITELGADNVLHPGAVIGDEPQDLTYTGVARSVKIGNRNVFREYTTVHRGSEHGDVTIMGDDNFMMQNAHVAHDCRVGNSTIIAGGALLAGWVELGDRALVSGNCVVHQYTRIGRLAMMRGLSRTSRDVPPFCIMDGTHTLRGINLVGLKRAGIPIKIDSRPKTRVHDAVRNPPKFKTGNRARRKIRPIGTRSNRATEFHQSLKTRRSFGPHDSQSDSES